MKGSSSTSGPASVVAQTNRKPKVIVIGAGFAGLSVAYHLSSLLAKERRSDADRKNDDDNILDTGLQLDLQIIEARDRIGGRVHPYMLDDETKVDLGGQWIHEASRDNPLRRLVEDELGLEFCDRTDEAHRRKNVVFDQDGSLVDGGLLKKAKKIFYKALEEYEYDDPKITSSTSFRDLLTDRLQLEMASDSRLARFDSNALQRVINYLVHKTEGYEGGTFEELAASLAYLYNNMGGPDQIVKGTYGSVLDALQSRINEKSLSTDIQLNKRVLGIEYNPQSDSDGGVRVTVTDMDGSNGGDITALSTTSTEKLHCDYCVCTVPLGVLKQRQINFIPPLPQHRIQAIDAIGMGLLNKIILKFDTCFWGDLKQFGMGHDDPACIKTFYDCSSEVDAEAVLIQFLAGEAADRVEFIDKNGKGKPGLSDEDAIEDSLKALQLMFGNNAVPRPVAAKVTRWRQDPFSCGAYTFAKVGSTAEMYDEIATPLGNLLFAGEHTSKYQRSTVHGAWETGKREANRIYQWIKKEQVKGAQA